MQEGQWVSMAGFMTILVALVFSQTGILQQASGAGALPEAQNGTMVAQDLDDFFEDRFGIGTREVLRAVLEKREHKLAAQYLADIEGSLTAFFGRWEARALMKTKEGGLQLGYSLLWVSMAFNGMAWECASSAAAWVLKGEAGALRQMKRVAAGSELYGASNLLGSAYQSLLSWRWQGRFNRIFRTVISGLAAVVVGASLINRVVLPQEGRDTGLRGFLSPFTGLSAASVAVGFEIEISDWSSLSPDYGPAVWQGYRSSICKRTERILQRFLLSPQCSQVPAAARGELVWKAAELLVLKRLAEMADFLLSSGVQVALQGIDGRPTEDVLAFRPLWDRFRKRYFSGGHGSGICLPWLNRLDQLVLQITSLKAYTSLHPG